MCDLTAGSHRDTAIATDTHPSLHTLFSGLFSLPVAGLHHPTPLSYVLSPASPPPLPTLSMAPCAFVPAVSAGALVARPAAVGTCRHVPAAAPATHGVRMLMGGGKGNEAGGKNPFGALGNMGNIMDAVKKAQQFTESAKELQDELKEVRRGCFIVCLGLALKCCSRVRALVIAQPYWRVGCRLCVLTTSTRAQHVSGRMFEPLLGAARSPGCFFSCQCITLSFSLRGPEVLSQTCTFEGLPICVDVLWPSAH